MVGSHGANAPWTPIGFISKWKGNTQTEKQIAHAHFHDLCRLFDHPTPADDDPSGDHFAFEKAATKIGGGKGYADVWKKNYFAWEYKSKNENLEVAHKQLMTYAPALGNPPLQVVCDFNRYRIYTAWTNTVPETHEILLDDFVRPDRLQILRNVFHDPEKLKPVLVRSALTKKAADKFATIALRMQGRGTPEKIAHFVNQLVFCFFADSVGLLPKGMWSKLLARAQADPAGARGRFDTLFAAMRSGEDYGAEKIVHFNGGLFDGQRALPLDEGDIGLLRAANSLDWSQIDPSIFGSLFERFLDPQKRAQIGAHYTDAEKIQKIIDPVILRPLRAEWDGVKADIEALVKGKKKPPMRSKPKRRMKPLEAAEERRAQFLKRLKEIKVLDPACGSGNFLYLALQGVKDIEHLVNLESEKIGLKPQLPFIGPEILKGIEINPVAAELARTTIWIGDIQWRMRNGIHSDKRPVLENLDTIVCGDALITRIDGLASTSYKPRGLTRGSMSAAAKEKQSADRRGKPGNDNVEASYVEAEWPEAEFIVGNPPFVGAKLMNRKIGREKTAIYRGAFDGRLAAFTDFVCYWFEKSRVQVLSGKSRRVGFVATNSIRKNTNLPVLKRIVAETKIFDAWNEEQWTIDGANVDVSIICFAANDARDLPRLNGIKVSHINADLTTGIDLTRAAPLTENHDGSFLGIQKSGPFDIAGTIAREWLVLPMNPNGLQNQKVLKPYWNGDDLTGRPRDVWFIDMPIGLQRRDAALWEAPFAHLSTARDEDGKSLQELRAPHGFESATERWWEPWRSRPAMRRHIERLNRYIVTPETAAYRLFVWLRFPILPDKNLIVIPRDDDVAFGILHSRFHEAWALRKGSDLEDRPRYTSSTTFETFPFPEGLTPNIPALAYADDPRAITIVKAAKRLDELRSAWLNPPNLIDIVPEVVPGYPDRILPKSMEAAAILKKRTLTSLYNERPQWLADVHRDLDAAVALAYGWLADISEDDALAKLLELNLARAGMLRQSSASEASIDED